MNNPEHKDPRSPRQIMREVMELCADCDTCRTMMEEDCAFFLELYRLQDQEKEQGIPVSDEQLRQLTELCTFCGLCPCPKVPMDIMEAKSRYIAREGLPLATRLINDVPRMAKLCSLMPRVTKALQSNVVTGPLLRKGMRIHPDRQLPVFPKQNFFQWAAAQGLDKPAKGSRRVAYFAGCTAGYLFPEIGISVVAILRNNNIAVTVPQQECCGMPFLVEGDRDRTLNLARDNMERLLEAQGAGYDLVYSCPTCGYFLKKLLKERAYYSDSYQQEVEADPTELKIPAPEKGKGHFWHLKKSMYRQILKDDGYFSGIDPLRRVALADHLFDFGSYLTRLLEQGQLNDRFSALPERMAYFAPCHQREQKMGSPYLKLMKRIPELDLEQIGSDYDCCGMGGVFGFKEHFHPKSLALGQSLMEKFRAHAPEAIVTDCMSCRLQFNHCLPYPVYHPVEVLARAYGSDPK